MATWAVLSETGGPRKLMCLEEGDQAEIGGQEETRDRRGYAFYGTMHESGQGSQSVGDRIPLSP